MNRLKLVLPALLGVMLTGCLGSGTGQADEGATPMVSQGDAASGRMLRTASVTREVFVAKAPYAATIGENSVPVDLGADRITHDFSGNVPFFNQEIGRSDIGTINVWNPQTGSQQNVIGHSLTDAGVPGYVFK